jgi:hypothetical protein
VFKYLKLSKQRNLFKEMTVSSFIRHKKKLRRCLNPSCSLILCGKASSTSGLVCSCGQKICPKCDGADHYPVPCKLMKIWGKIEETQLHCMTKIWIEVFTEPCPSCSVLIDNDSRHPFITCKLCKFRFCWVCKADLSVSFHYCSPQRNTQLLSVSCQKDLKLIDCKTRYQEATQRLKSLTAKFPNFEENKSRLKTISCLKKCLRTLMVCAVIEFFLRDSNEKVIFIPIFRDLEKFTNELLEALNDDFQDPDHRQKINFKEG